MENYIFKITKDFPGVNELKLLPHLPEANAEAPGHLHPQYTQPPLITPVTYEMVAV